MLGSQEKILGPKVNVKFFTVDPYSIHTVLQSLTLFSDLADLADRETCFSVVGSKKKSNMDSFWTILGFLGHRIFFGGLRRIQIF